MSTTRIIKEVNTTEFTSIINKQRISVSNHALDHLSEAQRRIFDQNQLIRIIIKERPAGVGIQKNGNYSAFYRRKWGYLRIILKIEEQKTEIVTFINTETMPNLSKLELQNDN